MPRAATTHCRSTDITSATSAPITTTQPVTTAAAPILPRWQANSTRPRCATSPYPRRPGANASTARDSTSCWSGWPGLNTAATGTATAASAAAPAHDTRITARVVDAVTWSNRSCSPALIRADSSGNALVAIGTARIAHGSR
ncbi:Uncharacterised protein [Mycobacterium tuberculosis]|nr:Uncharacterised protein [Mycobacterium tuberculosis]